MLVSFRLSSESWLVVETWVEVIVLFGFVLLHLLENYDSLQDLKMLCRVAAELTSHILNEAEPTTNKPLKNSI